MNRIEKVFADAREKGSKTLIPYLTLGYPSLSMTEKLAVGLWKSGAGILELGVPFSDPMADGPTIQASSQKALQNGVTLDHLWPLTRRLRAKTTLALAVMTYCNVIHRQGVEQFMTLAKKNGLDGVIVPDLSWEESGPYRAAAQRKGLSLIDMVAPTTPADRLRAIARSTSGFLYVVSVTGVTGARRKLSSQTLQLLKMARRLTKKPLALGFGVSKPAQAKRLRALVDGVVVGSAFVQRSHSVPQTVRLAKSLKKALQGGRNHAR